MHFLSMLQMLKLFLENMGAGKLVLKNGNKKNTKKHTFNRMFSEWIFIFFYPKLALLATKKVH